MRQLVGRANFRKVSITNIQAAMYTLPMIVIQIAILIIITFLDPPQATEIIDENGGLVVQHIVCQANSNALLITELIFEAGMVLIGCILAYMTRNMDSKFGEAKQLIFAMYNIALVGVIIVLVVSLAGLDSSARRVLQAVGVFWGTVVSSAAFVLPRMVQIRRDGPNADAARGQIRLSGLDPSGAPLPQQQSSNGSVIGLTKSQMESITEEGALLNDDSTPEFGEASIATNNNWQSSNPRTEESTDEESSAAIRHAEDDVPARTPLGNADEEQPLAASKQINMEEGDVRTSDSADDDVAMAGNSAWVRKRIDAAGCIIPENSRTRAYG